MDTLARSGENTPSMSAAAAATPSLSLAGRVGAEGSVTGIDISAPMLALAEAWPIRNRRARSIQFVEADAQIHAFEPDSFDVVFSRFGVMFFEDPVAAFTNIRMRCLHRATLAFLLLATARR